MIAPSLDNPVNPTERPAYKFGVFPIGRQADKSIPCNSGRPIDLVFSIVWDIQAEDWQMRFLEWQVVIKISAPGTGRKPDRDDFTSYRALLRSDKSDGPPPIMLSNLRYSVLIQKWDTKDGLLYISIVPRSK